MTAIFPALPGLGWSVSKTPRFATRVQRAVSGRELRVLDQPNPVWSWTLTYSMLRDKNDTRGARGPGAGYDELRTLMGFFLQQQGAFQPFLYDVDRRPGDGAGDRHWRRQRVAFPACPDDGNGLAGRWVCRTDNRAQFARRDLFQRRCAEPVGLYARSSDGNRDVRRAAAGGPAADTYYFRVRFGDDGADFENFLSALGAEAGQVPIRLRLRFGMRPATVALQDYLAANDSVVVIDLYTFVLSSGEVLRFSGWTTPLTIPGTLFPAGSLNYNAAGYTSFALGPRFGRSTVTTKIGIEPTELDISILAGAGDLVGDSGFADAVRVGQFDGATIELDRFFAPPQPEGSGAPAMTLGAVVWFYGRVADTDVGRSKIEMKVKSLLNLLAQQQMPRRLYRAACTHVFGDAMCTFNRASAAATATAAAGSNQATIVTGLSPTPATLYDQGTITGVSGANAGQSRTIAQLASSTVYAAGVALPGCGDTFELLPGCDHTAATCQNTFNNLAHFGGFPYIPPPELAV